MILLECELLPKQWELKDLSLIGLATVSKRKIHCQLIESGCKVYTRLGIPVRGFELGGNCTQNT